LRHFPVLYGDSIGYGQWRIEILQTPLPPIYPKKPLKNKKNRWVFAIVQQVLQHDMRRFDFCG
jgi:hypothetical protein